MARAAGPPIPTLPAVFRLAMEACMRARISGGMLAIICAIESDDIPGGIIPWGLMPDDASGVELCGVVASCAGVRILRRGSSIFLLRLRRQHGSDHFAADTRLVQCLQAAGRKIELRVIGSDGGRNRGFRQPCLYHFYDVGVGQRVFL